MTTKKAAKIRPKCVVCGAGVWFALIVNGRIVCLDCGAQRLREADE